MTICACDPQPWTMCLYKGDPCKPSNPPTQHTFCFEDVEVHNEIITGKVFDEGRKHQAYLSGTCSPFDHKNSVARMSFFFQGKSDSNVPVEIILTGWGYQPAIGNPIFVGGFVALEVKPEDPCAGVGSDLNVGFDPGDTGTGTGMQADCK